MEKIKIGDYLVDDKERTRLIAFYLKTIFRDRKKLINVKFDDHEEELSERVVSYALLQGLKTGEVVFKWSDNVPVPEVSLKNSEGKKFVEVKIDKKMYEIVESDFMAQFPDYPNTNGGYIETFIDEYMDLLAEGKEPFRVNPDWFVATGILKKMMKSVYVLYRQI